jgi:hypothetical protein
VRTEERKRRGIWEPESDYLEAPTRNSELDSVRCLFTMLRLALAVAAVALCACHPSPSARSTDEPANLDSRRFPTGVTLDPAGRSS